MSKKSDGLAIAVVIIASGLIAAAYLGGQHLGFARGYDTGGQPYQALNTKYQKLLTNDRQLTADKFNLQGAYNNTLANYNNLQSAVAKYNASLKTTSTRVNCNSFTYGINNQFTSTSCN